MTKYALSAAITLALASIVISPCVGESWISPISTNAQDVFIFTMIRIPRVLLAFLCGATLSLGGLVFQSMFRNPLATPYTLGVASGSSLAVAAWISLGVPLSILGVSGVSLAAMVGAGVSVFGVYQLAKALGGLASISLLLGGVVLSFFFSSMTMLVQYFADSGSIFRMLRWTMGSLGHADYDSIVSILPFLVLGFTVIIKYRYELDLMSIGDELAMSRGVELMRVRKMLFLAVSLMLAVVIAACGLIGFIGIIVPHFTRLVCGVGHKHKVLITALLGGCFLVWCDALARSITLGSDLPVGIITSLLGGPFFLFILLGKNRARM